MKSFVGLLFGMILSLFVYTGAECGLIALSFFGVALTIVVYAVLVQGGVL